MSRRYLFFFFHFLTSFSVLAVVIFVAYHNWYFFPFWYLLGAESVFIVLCLVDVVIGPLVTLVVSSPGKNLRVLKKDLSIVALLQFVALVYGCYTLWVGRPVYNVFVDDHFEVVAYKDLGLDAAKELSAFAPLTTVGAKIPSDESDAMAAVYRIVSEGRPLSTLPKYYVPIEHFKAEIASVDSAAGQSDCSALRARYDNDNRSFACVPISGTLRSSLALIDLNGFEVVGLSEKVDFFKLLRE